jgi:hypothetical protein
MYKEELQKMEEELAELENTEDEDLRKELLALEEQERELDKQLSEVEKQESTQK